MAEEPPAVGLGWWASLRSFALVGVRRKIRCTKEGLVSVGLPQKLLPPVQPPFVYVYWSAEPAGWFLSLAALPGTTTQEGW